MVRSKTVNYYIDVTFAISKAECKDKLRAISQYPEVKERLKDIHIGAAIKYDHCASLDGYCAYILEID